MTDNPYGEARAFIGNEFGISTYTYDDAKIRRLVEGLWTGGWEGFLRDNGFKSVEKPVTPDTDIGKLSLIRAAVGQSFRIGMLDWIKKFEITDDMIYLKVVCHETQTWYSRIRVHQQGLRVYIWDFVDGRWRMREDFPVTRWFDKKPFDVLGQYSKWRSPLAAWMDEWQVEFCYRPGTKKSPMDGPYARDEAP